MKSERLTKSQEKAQIAYFLAFLFVLIFVSIWKEESDVVRGKIGSRGG